MVLRVAGLALVGAAVAASGCVVVPAGGYRRGSGAQGGGSGEGYRIPSDNGDIDGPVLVAPPPVQAEVIGVAPYPGWFWISGYWTWRLGRHVWIGGRWESPRRGWGYVPHRWEPMGRGWREAPGRWERR